MTEPIDIKDRRREQRAEAQQRQNRARIQVARVLVRSFTRDELGQLFDELPDTTTQPMATLTAAVSEAWLNTYQLEATE